MFDSLEVGPSISAKWVHFIPVVARWQLEVIGPKIDGALLPHVEKFKRDWEEFTHRKKALTEGALIAGFGRFLQEKYFHWNSTT